VGHYNKMSSEHNPYGDGKAVPRIVAALSSGQFAPS
jgi:UDP-N-acetylglucosamine 2-epimerase